MSSGAHKQRDQALGGALALLVQSLFLLLVLLSPSHPPRATSLSRETILFFPPLAVPKPSVIDARAPRKPRGIAPARAPAPPPVTARPSPATPSLAPPSGIAGFGRSLFSCAPEQYASLTDEQRSHCPKPAKVWPSTRRPT
jgi:hypothetical protein